MLLVLILIIVLIGLKILAKRDYDRIKNTWDINDHTHFIPID